MWSMSLAQQCCGIGNNLSANSSKVALGHMTQFLIVTWALPAVKLQQVKENITLGRIKEVS